MTQPLVSVIVPVLNGERFLSEALDSVTAQSYPRLEVLVVDGGSSDSSVEIAGSREGVEVIPQRGRGLGNAWNEGIAASSGQLISFLDSDDRWLPGKLKAQVELLEERPELDAAIGHCRFFLEPGHEPPPGLRPELLTGDHLARMPGALLARRPTFERLGDFDESYSIAVDIDWFARLKDAGMELGAVPEVVIEKRVHDSNLSHSDLDRNSREIAQLLHQSIQRQRREP